MGEVAAQVTSSTVRRWTIRLWIVVSVVLTVTALWLLVLNHTLRDDPATGLSVLMVATYAGLGAFLAIRVPSNPIGRLFLVVGLGLLLGGASTEYAKYGLVTDPGAVPFALFAAWVSNWAFLSAGMIPMVLVLFPTGHVPSPAWRWVPYAVLISLAALVVAMLFRPGRFDVTETVTAENPFGIRPLAEAFTVVVWVAGLTLLVGVIGSVASVIARLRGATGEEKQQVRWLAAVATATGVTFVIAVLTTFTLGEGETSALNDLAFLLFFVCLSIGVPTAVAVALLRYRLYDLDIVIKKTFLYVTVAGLLLLLFVALAVVVVAIFGRSQRAAVLTALIVGLSLWPAFRLARRVADRIVYGGRSTPYEVLTSFGKRMSETYASEDVLARTAQLLASATGATQAAVWLRVGRELRAVGSWPGADARQTVIEVDHDDLPHLPADWAEPVRDRGDLIGALAVTMPANDPIGPGRQQLMRDLADQAGLALRNVRLIEELRASRQRLVAAQDEERRRLERNIHDGVQQQLVALAVKLRLADALVERDPARAHEAIAALQADAGTALEDLRDLARGIYPPLLADKGLEAALEAQARRATMPVTLETAGIERYPRDVEATVYFCALEALTNIAKYADATTVTLRVEHHGGELAFSVRDDGRGFDPEAIAHGTGLQGMADRLEAVGGSLTIRSAPGSGTTVTGAVPTP